MWSAFEHAGLTSDSRDPLLAQFATDDALNNITHALDVNRGKGLVIRGKLVINPSVTAATPADSPNNVAIKDCVDDTNWLKYQKASGKLDDVPGGRHETTAVVEKLGGWRVTSFALDGRPGTC